MSSVRCGQQRCCSPRGSRDRSRPGRHAPGTVSGFHRRSAGPGFLLYAAARRADVSCEDPAPVGPRVARMPRPILLGTFAGALYLGAGAQRSCRQCPPNIAMTRDHRSDRVGRAGNQIARTPNIDGPPARGGRFNNGLVGHVDLRGNAGIPTGSSAESATAPPPSRR